MKPGARSETYLVVGLGNPTARYHGTRHNIGFRVADVLLDGDATVERFDGVLGKLTMGGRSVVVLKPMTYMNASGRSVRPAVDFYKVDPTRLIVVHDELDVPLGQVRLKLGGGEAGHNGLRSISQELGSKDYVRLRVGIGRPPKEFLGSVSDFVLQAFPLAEQAAVDGLVQSACSAIRLVLERGFDSAMNEVNRKN
jgi:PTH1 family peptidyl-tRNA hydrolase